MLASGPDLLGYDHYLISLSGGKDSQALLDVLVELFAEAGVLDRVTTVHADMGRSDWPGTVALAREHAEHYGLRHELVARTGCDLLDRVAERGKWPDKDRRWCAVDQPVQRSIRMDGATRDGPLPRQHPETMRAALHRGQLSVEELVDRYAISNQPVRQLLIEYFRRRAADTDYSSLSNLTLMIAHHFWARIEQINPDQADLRISTDTYTRWREAIKTRDDGKPRTGQDVILIGVRSFYYDPHTWAAEEPEKWAVWVAPCPIPPAELRGLAARRRRINDRSANRTRIRQPLLPTLVKYVEDRYDRARTLLEQARAVAVGETFVHQDALYRCVERTHHAQPDDPVRIRDEATGTVLHIQSDEDAAFWDWACVETLRHSAARIEEMCELTHLSIRQYQRPNGEVIALLVIAPSKTDRERVIPMSAELFHVIAAIVRRHTSGGQPIPVVSRFDPHDKVWSAPMPFLFQRRTGASAVSSPAAPC
ncbi:hypothetical protein [Nocardia gipuzkoensis]